MTKKYKIRKIQTFLFILGLDIVVFKNIAFAFVPYVYEPKLEKFKEDGITFGKSAAQLVHFGQIKDAIRLAELSVRLNPNDDRLWAILAESQIRNNDYNSARYSLNKAKIINPKRASLWFIEGGLELQERNHQKAINLINQGLKLEPKNAGAYFQLGNARIMQSKLRLAFEAFKKASSIKPSFWEALNNKALVMYEMDKIQSAIKTWRNVLTIEENAEPMLALAAALYKNEGTVQEALFLAKEALAKNPNYVSSTHQEEQLWGKKLQKATKQLLKDPGLIIEVKKAWANADLSNGS